MAPQRRYGSQRPPLRTFYTEKNLLVAIEGKLNDGGQGEIFSLHKSSKLKDAHGKAVKLFKQPASPALEQKLRALMAHAFRTDTDTAGICYPQALLYAQADQQGGCMGYVMNYYPGSEIRSTVCSPKVVREYWKWSRRDLCRFAAALLRRFMVLHKEGLLMGDVNDRNVLAKADNPDVCYFVDVDGYQIDSFPSGAHTTEFDPSRLLSCQDFENVMRTREDEYYSISALLFKIFLVGQEPYSNGGEGTLEQNRLLRRFMFPLGYDSPDNIRGPWQRIWYNLPLNMRQAFYDTFHDRRFVPVADWLQYISEYYTGIQSGRYPDVILIPRTERVDSIFLGTDGATLPPVENNDALRQFDNWLNPDHPVDNHKTAYLEFGAASFRVYEPRMGTKTNIQHIRTGHFDFISPQGEMDVERLYDALMQPEAWPYWQRYLRGVVPPIGHLTVFGGAGLRHLRNREQVVQMMRERLGLNVGIVSQQEEAALMVSATMRKLRPAPCFLLVNTSGMGTTIIYQDGKNAFVATEIHKLGSKVMRNGLFATIQPDSRLKTKLEEHDRMVSNAIAALLHSDALKMQDTPLQLVAMGILGKTTRLTGIVPEENGFTRQQLTNACQMLGNELLTNRDKAIFLKQDIIDLGTGDNLTQRTELRLCLPIFIEMMKQLGANSISLVKGGVGKAYVDDAERNKR